MARQAYGRTGKLLLASLLLLCSWQSLAFENTLGATEAELEDKIAGNAAADVAEKRMLKDGDHVKLLEELASFPTETLQLLLNELKTLDELHTGRRLLAKLRADGIQNPSGSTFYYEGKLLEMEETARNHKAAWEARHQNDFIKKDFHNTKYYKNWKRRDMRARMKFESAHTREHYANEAGESHPHTVGTKRDKWYPRNAAIADKIMAGVTTPTSEGFQEYNKFTRFEAIHARYGEKSSKLRRYKSRRNMQRSNSHSSHNSQE